MFTHFKFKTIAFVSISFYLATSFATAQKLATATAGDVHLQRPKVEVCFVLDTTGSMSGLIQSAKDKIWSIANSLISTDPKPEISFALIGYRDVGDSYVTQLTNLTTDIDLIHTQLMAFKADGGGDGPESVNQALHESVQKVNWTADRKVLKIVFLVGDAPPHMDYPNDIKYPEVCTDAMSKGLIINTVQCGNDSNTTMIWKEIATKSEGQFVAIPQDGGAVAIATPFDSKIAAINGRLNLTVCGYGDMKQQQLVAEKLATNAASNSEAIADRAGFLSKSRAGSGGADGGAKVVGGNDDLVELIIEGKITIEKIESDKLPDDLKQLDNAGQQAELEKRVKSRKKLQKEIDELVQQRSQYIEKEKLKKAESGDIDSFDVNVKKMIREQAAKKGIQYK